MAKRILSWVLSMVLLLGCVSGLTLVTSAENVVKAANLSPDTYDGGQGAIFKGKYDGFDVFGWQKTGWASWNNAKVANALGVAHGTVVDTLTFTLDYYWDKGAEGSDNNWWEFKTTNEDGSTTEGNGFSTLLNQGMSGGAWKEVSITRDKQKLGAGDDLFINFGELNNSKFYVRGMKVVATVGEDTYTALWGSYLTASIDFKSGEAVLKNMKGLDKRGDAAQTATPEAIGDTGLHGVKLGISNSGIKFFLDNLPAFTEPMAVSVEYYMDSTVVGDNSRINFRVEGGNRQSYVLRKGMFTGADVVNTDKNLVTDKAGLYTFVISDANALEKLHGELGFIWWGGKTGDYAHILSVSIFPASYLNTVENPGYDYIDFTNSVSPNPYYPTYTEDDIVGMKWTLNGTEGKGTLTENGMEMTSGTLYIDSALARGKSPIGVKVYFAEGTEGTISFQYNADPEKVADNPNYKGINPEIVDGVAAFILDDAKFDGKQNAGCSARMYADGKTIKRIEVYALADKTALNEAIAKEVNFEGKTEASVANYNAAKAAAEAVAADAWALESAIKDAVAALAAAEAALKDIPNVGYGTAFGHMDFDHFEGEYKDEGSNIGFTDQGEWFEYEVNVTEDGLYTINVEMATGNADCTVEVQNGEGKAYGSFVVPSKGWGNYETYTVTAALQAGVQKIRILYKQSSANYRGMKLGDGRYTLTNATWLPTFVETTNPHYGVIEKKDGRYAWHIQHNKGMAIGFASGYEALKDVTSVTIELDYWLESNETYTGKTEGFDPNNRRFLLKVGANDVVNEAGVGNPKNTFNMGSVSTLGGEFDKWSTVKFEMTDVDMTQTFWSAASLRVMFFDEGSKTAEDGPGCYISGFRVYATEDPSKIIAINFTETVNKTALRNEVNSVPEDLSIYTTSSVAALNAALEAAREVLNSDVEQEAIDAALANLQAAKAALTPVYTLQNVTGFQGWCAGTIVKYDGSYAWMFDPTGNNKGLSLGGYNGVLNESTTVVYEVVAQFEQNANAFTLWYGTNGEQKNTNMACVPEAVGNWHTFTLEVENFDYSKTYASTPLTMFGHPGDQGNKLYVRSFKVYDANDPSKVVSLEFATYLSKRDLQTALDNAIEDLSDYTEASAAAYTEALEAIAALLEKEEVSEEEIGAALAALTAAEDALVSTIVKLPDPSWTNKDEETNPTFSEFDGKNCLSWVGTGAMSWNNGVIRDAFGLEDQVVDLEITLSYYWKGNNGGNWMHFNTFDKNGESAPGITNGNPHDNGFGSFVDYGMVSDKWANLTVAREEQLLDAAHDNLYINVGSLGENNALYICGITYQVTLEDGTVMKAVWGEPIVIDTAALQDAVDNALSDLSAYTEESAKAYTDAVNAGKALLEKEDLTQADIDAAVKAIKDAKDGLVEITYDVIVTDITTTLGKNPVAGDVVKFMFTVKNNGTTTIPEGSKFGGIIKINGELVAWSDNYKGADKAPALAPGETIVLTTCGGPNGADGSVTLAAGTYKVLAQVNDNPGDGIKESNLENNTMEVELTVRELNVTDLREAIAEEVEDLDKYDEESVKAYKAAVEAAKKALDEATTQEEVDAAVAALAAAKAALKLAPSAELGDVDGDGKITSTDARLVLQFYAEKVTAEDLNINVADVDGDGKITSTDARLILQLYAGKITEFPTPAQPE